MRHLYVYLLSSLTVLSCTTHKQQEPISTATSEVSEPKALSFQTSIHVAHDLNVPLKDKQHTTTGFRALTAYEKQALSYHLAQWIGAEQRWYNAKTEQISATVFRSFDDQQFEGLVNGKATAVRVPTSSDKSRNTTYLFDNNMMYQVCDNDTINLSSSMDTGIKTLEKWTIHNTGAFDKKIEGIAIKKACIKKTPWEPFFKVKSTNDSLIPFILNVTDKVTLNDLSTSQRSRPNWQKKYYAAFVKRIFAHAADGNIGVYRMSSVDGGKTGFDLMIHYDLMAKSGNAQKLSSENWKRHYTKGNHNFTLSYKHFLPSEGSLAPFEESVTDTIDFSTITHLMFIEDWYINPIDGSLVKKVRGFSCVFAPMLYSDKKALTTRPLEFYFSLKK